MKIFDFLIYYLTRWFEERKGMLKWSTPLERAIYCLTMISICWLLILDDITCFFLFKVQLSIIPLVVLVIIGLLASKMFSQIYIANDRYAKLKEPHFFKMRKAYGKALSIIVVLLSFIMPYLIFMIFTQ